MQLTRRTGLYVLAMLTWLAAQSAWAWDDTGHMTVAELAYRQLKKSARTNIANLLREHPHYHTLLATNCPPGVNLDEWVFLQAATWPDQVRPSMNSQHPKPEEITKYHHGAWHYVNFPVIVPDAVAQFHESDFPLPPETILTALDNAIATLKTKNAPAADRAVSLCWLLHLTGDIHQPLHTAMLVSKEFPKGDEGGNLLAVRHSTNAPVRLHVYWDDMLGTSTRYRSINFLANKLGKGSPFNPTKWPEYKINISFRSWAEESLTAARTVAYEDGKLTEIDWRSVESSKIAVNQVVPLSPKYEKEALDTAQRRVALAGARLATQLKKLF